MGGVWGSRGVCADDERAEPAERAATGRRPLQRATVGWLPYWLGTTAVETLVEIGGNSVMNDVLRDPPTTSEQLIDIAEWYSGEREFRPAVEVELPDIPAGAAVVDRGTLGIAKISVLPLTFEDEFFPEEFISGWRGDSYVTWRDGERVCTTVMALFDADADVSAATDVLDEWAERTDGELEPVDEGAASPGLMLESCTG